MLSFHLDETDAFRRYTDFLPIKLMLYANVIRSLQTVIYAEYWYFYIVIMVLYAITLISIIGPIKIGHLCINIEFPP